MIWLTKSFVGCDNFHTRDFLCGNQNWNDDDGGGNNNTLAHAANKRQIRNLYDLFGWWHWILE